MKSLRYLLPAFALMATVVYYLSASFNSEETKSKHIAQLDRKLTSLALQHQDDATTECWRCHQTLTDLALQQQDDAASVPLDKEISGGAGSTAGELEKLSESEQKSLWEAISEARREARPIPESWAGREENLGYDYYAMHPKQSLTTRFGSKGVQMVSSNRTYTEQDALNPNTAWSAQMHILSFAGKDVPLGASAMKSEGSKSRMEYRHSHGLTEWYDNGVEAMEHGYTIARRPTHLDKGEEVVIEVALDGLKAVEHSNEDGSHQLNFVDGEREVLGYSKLLVIDAQGKELPARMQPTATGFSLAYNDAQAAYPVTVDPLITNQLASSAWFDSADDDFYGYSVAISEDIVVVGANGADDGGSNSGTVYVISRSDGVWYFETALIASDAAADDAFGSSVAISGDTVVVGASGADDGGSNSGSAYVFTRNATFWSEQAKLTASDAAADDAFGSSVAITGNAVVVGAAGNDHCGEDSGSAYVFARIGTSWFQETKLTASDAAAGDFFGHSVAIAGDTVVVGAYGDDDDGSNSGSAYVFTRNATSWSEQAKLTASDAAEGDSFGFSVAISADSVVVGAYREGSNLGVFRYGCAYVFTRVGAIWTQEAKLRASDQGDNDFFGFSVAISGDTLVVGAHQDDDNGSNSGSAYVFTRSGTTWTQELKLNPDPTLSPAGDVDDNFGYSVATSGDLVVVGAIRAELSTVIDDDKGGRIYIFSLTEEAIRKMMVHDHLGLELLHTSTANAFPGTEVGRDESFTFRVSNVGEEDLRVDSILIGGLNSDQFGTPPISTTTLSANQSFDFTIGFSPVGISGMREATVIIASDGGVFSFGISGLGLSATEDGDSDGMNDWAEYVLRGFGFDWQTNQSGLVGDYYNNAHLAGLYTKADAAGVSGDVDIFDVDLVDNTVVFTIGLNQSLDLDLFDSITLEPGDVTVEDGKIRCVLDAPAGKKFFTSDWGP